MPSWFGVELALLLAGLAALGFSMARRRSRIVVDKVFRAEPDDVWALCYFTPEMPQWMEMIDRIEWSEGSETDGVIVYKQGMRATMRQKIDQASRQVATHMEMINDRGEPGERFVSLVTVTPDHGGARYRMTCDVEQVGRLGLMGWLGRLTRPLVGVNIGLIMQQELERNGAFARYAAEHGEAPAPASLLGMRLSWGALALAVVALGYWGWSFGLWFTVALAVGLVLHEAGHVAVMRMLGDRTSAFYFVPFMGGVAIGRKKHAHDGTITAMVFGGPLAGLGSAVAAMLLGFWFENDFLLACGYFFALFNLFNLAPIPPLDGGQILMTALRPFVPEAVLHWVSTALLVAGAALGLWLQAPIFTAVFALLAVLAFAVPRVPIERRPLSRGVAALSLGCLVLLALALMAVIGVVGSEMTFIESARALTNGPFAD
jgi:Zn-dependent protease